MRVCFSCQKWVSIIVWVIAGAGVYGDWLEGKVLSVARHRVSNKDTRRWREPSCFSLCLSLNIPGSVPPPTIPFQVPATHRLWFRDVDCHPGCFLFSLFVYCCVFSSSLQVLHGGGWQKTTPADFWSEGSEWIQGIPTSGTALVFRRGAFSLLSAYICYLVKQEM